MFFRRGYLEARQCNLAPWGGIETQAAVLEPRVKDSVVAFESGVTFVRGEDAKNKKRLPAMRRQALLTADALARLHTVVLSPGGADMNLGEKTVRALAKKVPFVSANIQFRGRPAFPLSKKVSTPIGELCFVGLANASFGPSWEKGWTVAPPEKTLGKALEQCGEAMQVVLTDLHTSDTFLLQQSFPTVRLWIGGEGDYPGLPVQKTLSPLAEMLSARSYAEDALEISLRRLPKPNESWSFQQKGEAGPAPNDTVVAIVERIALQEGTAAVPAWAKDLFQRWSKQQ